MKYLIVNGDDLGLTHSMNEGVMRATKGLLTSTSIMANGFAYDHAVKNVLPEIKDIGIGVHLCLNEGVAVSSADMLPELTDENGWFKRRFIKGFLFLATQWWNKKIAKEAEIEIRSQIEKIIAVASIDHLDGHNHVHMIPWIFNIVCKCASDYGVKWIRMADEPFNRHAYSVRFPSLASLAHYVNLKRWSSVNRDTASRYGVKCNDVLYGVLYSGYMSENISLSYLDCATIENSVTEILFHPGVINDQQDLSIDRVIMHFSNDKYRFTELGTITSLVVRQKIEEKGFTLTNYGGLPL
jgi:predicted glycoside hydrolase/deacetylase ChbG (UPF0249 family)